MGPGLHAQTPLPQLHRQGRHRPATLKTGSSGASVSLRGAVAFGYSPVPEAVGVLA